MFGRRPNLNLSYPVLDQTTIMHLSSVPLSKTYSLKSDMLSRGSMLK